ncbi:MAG: tetratricopeptide repeat protein [Bacteroidales bacterium]|nr:tetratricopeptide repeat protein [Bacteroidales bacterium]
MKRILIALAVLLAVQVADAQVKSPAAAAKAVTSAEAASKDAKKAAKVATWVKLAQSYMDAYNAPVGNAWIGATAQELSLLMGSEKPVSETQVELNGTPYLKVSYSNKDFYYGQDLKLAMIIVTQPVVEDALAKSFEAWKKAYEVDAKQSKVKDINAGLASIAQKYVGDAYNAYQFGDLAKASKLFAAAAEVSATAPYSNLDKDALYNAGFTAWMAKDYAGAQKYFEECVANEYYYDDGEVFAKLADIHKNLGNGEKVVAILEEGFSKFPQSQSILIGLINYYLENKQDPARLFELIDLAKQNEPNNASLYYVEGNINKELGKNEEAIAAYYKCADINPEYEFGYIGAGILYYELAVKLSEEASNEYDDAKYMALVEQFEKALHDAIDPFEKAFAISKDNSLKVNIAEYLKNIYYRFISKGADYEAGYKKYDEIVKNGLN